MNEQKNTKSPLAGFPKKSPFDVPEGYFETLQDKIEARIEAEENPLTKKQQVIRILKPVLSLAASFALVYLLVYYPLDTFLPKFMAKNTEKAVVEKSASEEDLLFSYLSISEDSAYELFGENNDEASANEEVSDEEVIDYLALDMNETEIYAELKN